MIIIVFGLPGSGKSYFASKLAEQLNAEYTSSDVIRKQLIEKRNYSEKEKFFVYKEMTLLMTRGIKQRKNMVIDATFFKEELRNNFEEVAKKLDEDIIFIEVIAEEEIIKIRTSKKREFSEADYSVYLQLKEVFEPMKKEHLILKSTQINIGEMLQIALTYIHEQSTNN